MLSECLPNLDYPIYLYFRNFHKDADTVVPKGCDAKCRAKMLCPVVTTNIADQGRCNRVKQHILGHQDL